MYKSKRATEEKCANLLIEKEAEVLELKEEIISGKAKWKKALEKMEKDYDVELCKVDPVCHKLDCSISAHATAGLIRKELTGFMAKSKKPTIPNCTNFKREKELNRVKETFLWKVLCEIM